jgi:hypothetical protein
MINVNIKDELLIKSLDTKFMCLYYWDLLSFIYVNLLTTSLHTTHLL